MDKKWIICIIIAIIIIGLCFGIGLAIFNSDNNQIEGTDIIGDKELASINSTPLNAISYNNTLETSATEDIISPNAIIIKKTYYEACDHLIKKVEDIPEELVNKSEKDLSAFFPDWKVEEYSPTEITLYKTSKDNCGEHYFVQEHNGVIGIYTTDKYGVKTLKEDTEISTLYLPEEDVQNLKVGVEIIGHTKLVEFLEDYE